MTERHRLPRRPIFALRLCPEPNVDPIRALRALLKIALRRLGLRAIEVREERVEKGGEER